MLKETRIFFAIIIAAIIIGIYYYSNIPRNNGIAEKVIPSTNDYSHVLKNIGIATSESSASCGADNNTIVTKVIDGDTVVVEGGYHVRLLGMDADEKGYPCYEPAKTRLENLVLGKQVILEKDKTDVDQYGRCLRYIFLGAANIDVQLVKEGLAVARFYAPDLKYKAEITSAEKQAQTGAVGCKWASSK